ncbi:hypothetical protein LXM94_06965 [Rhizobium sp. TRM95111]|uniref:hypothetical protein n=1 Tax=Rhizobium alarense TaxID=2846851 RepID=UPI001F3918F8|nr:hypothetical protein [Rhizobium alarense]MCF3639708.1 hypothetical protein [Rhizobium alarense]
MKFVPAKLRLSRKVLVLVAGVLVLSGASGAAAVFVGRDAILGPPAEKVTGVSCTVVNTVRLERDGQHWVRRYVRAHALDGDVRVKTALRVAGAFANKEEADLYQVVLLDDAGPAHRADMRGRAIGAEVLFARNPAVIPGMTAPFVARYVDGAPSANGEFYGEKHELSLDEIKEIVTAMSQPEDCSDPGSEGGEDGHGAPSEVASADHGSGGHGDETPAADHGGEEERGEGAHDEGH